MGANKMDSIISISKDICESNIKYNLKGIREHIFWTVFIVCVTCFDLQTLINSPGAFLGALFGAMLITSVRYILVLFELYSELQSEKLRYKFLTELHDIQMSSDDRNQYIKEKKYYEQLKESLQKTKLSEHN